MSQPTHLNAQKSRVFKASCIHDHKSTAIPRARMPYTYALPERACQFGTGSRCLTRAVKPICHREAYLISVYRNPNAFPQANGSFCHGPGVLRGRAKTKGRDRRELALLPSKGVTLGVRELCRNPPPKHSLPKQPVASCKQKDHCPFLSQSCPPHVAIPSGGSHL